MKKQLKDCLTKEDFLTLEGYSVGQKNTLSDLMDTYPNLGYEDWRFLYRRRMSSNHMRAMVRCLISNDIRREYLKRIYSPRFTIEQMSQAITGLQIDKLPFAQVLRYYKPWLTPANMVKARRLAGHGTRASQVNEFLESIVDADESQEFLNFLLLDGKLTDEEKAYIETIDCGTKAKIDLIRLLLSTNTVQIQLLKALVEKYPDLFKTAQASFNAKADAYKAFSKIAELDH